MDWLMGVWDWSELDNPQLKKKDLESYSCCPQSESLVKTLWCPANEPLMVEMYGVVRKKVEVYWWRKRMKKRKKKKNKVLDQLGQYRD